MRQKWRICGKSGAPKIGSGAIYLRAKYGSNRTSRTPAISIWSLMTSLVFTGFRKCGKNGAFATKVAHQRCAVVPSTYVPNMVPIGPVERLLYPFEVWWRHWCSGLSRQGFNTLYNRGPVAAAAREVKNWKTGNFGDTNFVIIRARDSGKSSSDWARRPEQNAKRKSKISQKMSKPRPLKDKTIICGKNGAIAAKVAHKRCAVVPSTYVPNMVPIGPVERLQYPFEVWWRHWLTLGLGSAAKMAPLRQKWRTKDAQWCHLPLCQIWRRSDY